MVGINLNAEKLSEIYQAHNGFGRETSTLYTDKHEQRLNSEIENLSSKREQVRALDLGCGNGTSSVRMAKSGAIVTAVDLNPGTVETVCRISTQAGISPDKIRVVTADLRSLNGEVLLPKYFDFVLCNRVLHHLAFNDASALLGKVARTLRPNGRFYLTVPSPAASYAQGYDAARVSLRDRFMPLATPHAKEHNIFGNVCFYYPDELIETVEDAGLTVVHAGLSEAKSNKIVALRL